MCLMSQSHEVTMSRQEKIRNLLWEIADVERLTSFFQNAMGPWPMQEVVPRAVRAAVRIDTMT